MIKNYGHQYLFHAFLLLQLYHFQRRWYSDWCDMINVQIWSEKWKGGPVTGAGDTGESLHLTVKLFRKGNTLLTQIHRKENNNFEVWLFQESKAYKA